ncbi:MAG: tetratricopeptide repeat protein [Coprobacter sp.]|nr:tetratricopeptide repeat protein [Coprobacter sp.]
MTNTEIETSYRGILSLLEEKRLKEAFYKTAELAALLPDEWQITDKLSELESSYRYMVQYMLDGLNDPNRQTFYNSLLLSAYTLADKTVECLLEKESTALYYQKKRYYKTRPEETIQTALDEVDKATGDLSLNSLLNDIDNNPDVQTTLRQKAEQAENELFVRIWSNYPASEWDYSALEEGLSPARFPNETVVLIIAALTLNILHRYDEKKLDMLLTVYSASEEEEIRQRALCSALILFFIYRKRVNLSPALTAHIEALKEEDRFSRDVRNIFLQLIKSRETERISRKFTEELLPEMMKLSPSLYNKINPTDIDPESGSPDPNPEWQELLEQSGIADKIKELNDLQMEGSDVFLSTFSGLKSFPFFQELGNWFRLFTSEHSAIQDIFPDGENGKNNFLQLIGYSRFLCNSDKYSFCLSLKQVPASQRQMMTMQFNAEGADMAQIEKERRETSADETKTGISNQYIQDLYRFFKLHNRRNEFHDLFAHPIDLMQVDSLQSILDSDETLRIIGELYFKKAYYDDALILFRRLSDRYTTDNGLYQKIGYCLQTAGQYDKALEAYLQAEIIQPDNTWTVRRIAACYRSLKNSQKALEYYLRAESLQPDNLSIELLIGHCYVEEKNYEEALKYYFKVDYLKPESGKAWRPIAWCSFLTGKHEQALRYYEKILSNVPSALDYMNAGHVELALKHTRRALELYRQSISLDNNDTQSFVNNFKQDIPELVRAGVAENDIPILLDQLLYQIS